MPATSLTSLQHQMQHQGVRRLLVFSGEAGWCEDQARHVSAGCEGDWLWLSDSPPAGVNACSPSAARTLLGQDVLHGIFDARSGLDVEALAAFSGTLKAGSWLILLVPPWQLWAQQPDSDSLRWSEQPQPIATPRFIQRFQRLLQNAPHVALCRQDTDFELSPLPVAARWLPPDGQPTPQQQTILQRLYAGKIRCVGADCASWPWQINAGRYADSTVAGHLLGDGAGQTFG